MHIITLIKSMKYSLPRYLRQAVVFLVCANNVFAAIDGTAQTVPAEQKEEQTGMKREVAPRVTPRVDYINLKHQDPLVERMRLRNEGVAHYESGIALKKALTSFERALAIQPDSAVENYNYAVVLRKYNRDVEALQYFNVARKLKKDLPHAYYSIGLISRKQGDIKGALNAFSQALEYAPQEASIHYQLSRIEDEQNRTDKALQYIVNTLHLDPYHTGALYQLYLYHQQQGDKEEAARLFKEFSRIKRALGKTRLDINPDESRLALPIDSNEESQLPQASPDDKLVQFNEQSLFAGSSFRAYSVFDVDRDQLDDLVVADSDGLVRWAKNEGDLKFSWRTPFTQGGIADIHAIDVGTLVVGGGVDFIIATGQGLYLLKDVFVGETEKADKGAKKNTRPNVEIASNSKNPSSREATPALIKLSDMPAESVRLFDIDHDGDLDVLADLFSQVLINDGNAGFTIKTDYLPGKISEEMNRFPKAVATDLRNRTSVDWVVYRSGGGRKLLQDEMGGHYGFQEMIDAQPRQVVNWIGAADMDNDGWSDLVYLTKAGLELDRNLQGRKFQSLQLHGALTGGGGVTPFEQGTIADFNNDGLKDVFLAGGGKAPVIALNRGRSQFQLQPLKLKPLTLDDTREAVPVDLNNDGKLDLVALDTSGELRILSNETSGDKHWVKLSLSGNRSAPDGQYTQVEVRYGTFYSMYESAGGNLHIPLGDNPYAEILRITWPNGFVENKFRVDGNRHWHFTESERISGSCPSIYTRSGDRFHYITDAFVSGPMGVPIGEGKYFSVDDDEYIKLAADRLEAVDGEYKVSIVEELREVDYFDQIKLFAVDHPQGMEVFPNEYLRYNDFPRFTLHATTSADSPDKALRVAYDHHGNDVTAVINSLDGVYISDLEPLQYTGFSETNYVELVLSEAARSSDSLRLFLTGWFYYFDSTSLVAAGQNSGLERVWPQVQAYVGGEWIMVREFGLPAGKGKTVTVDLSGLLPPGTSKLRIVSSFQLYWDRILVDMTPPPSETYPLRELPLQNARLRLHGFSTLLRDKGATEQPDRFDYQRVRFESFWDPLPGKYTRYGEVDELLEAVDSRMVVFGSADELALGFDATVLPPPAPGMQRDFILYINGFVKDGDKYTAHSDGVDPMPYAGMRRFPFPAPERNQQLVEEADYQRYLDHYQTRDPLTFTRPTRE